MTVVVPMNRRGNYKKTRGKKRNARKKSTKSRIIATVVKSNDDTHTCHHQKARIVIIHLSHKAKSWQNLICDSFSDLFLFFLI